MFSKQKNISGQTLIELLLAIGMMAILLPAIVVAIITSRQGKPQQVQRLTATELLDQAVEAVRSVREGGWTTFATNGTYYPQITGSGTATAWTLTACPVVSGNTVCPVSNGFTTQVVISDVYRLNGTIVSSGTSGAAVDPSTKQAFISISWTSPFTSTTSATLYLTRHDNLVHTDTTQTSFNSGTATNTSVVATTGSGISDDGQVQLGAGGGGGDWCQPSKSITTVDLPKSGVANAISAIEGTVFAGTGDNSSGVSFAKVALTTTQNPPPASISATFDGYKTNAVFGESGYAYLGTDNNSKEVVIMSLTQYSNSPTNTKYLEVGSINLPGNQNGQSVFVTNNKAYVTGSDSKLYIYSLAANRTSATLQNAGGLSLDGVGQKILVAGNYAYIATNSTTKEMDIVDISNAASPSIKGNLALGTGQSGKDLFVNTATTSAVRAYLVTSTAAGKKDFYIVNVKTPTAPSLKDDSGNNLGQYDTNGMTPTGVTVVTGNRAIVVGTGGTNQYQVVSISNELAPSNCANLQYATGVYGVASVLQANGYAYSYIITGDTNAELKIILGGAGGQYSAAGTYESAPFYTSNTYLSTFNRFTANVSQPPSTTIKMQVAIAKAVSNSCSGVTYSYLGPNNDAAQYYTPSGSQITGILPIYTSGAFANPGQCFRYKVWYTSTDSTATPELYDMNINYSP